MAGETQEATDGYMGEFHLQKASALYELRQVKNFGVPSPGSREQQETTHLKSPGRRREYISTFFEDSDFEVVMNTRVLSDTDILCDDARNLGDERPFKAVIPENGAPVAQITGTCKCIGYDRGEVTDGVMEATATFRVVTIDAIAAYSAGA